MTSATDSLDADRTALLAICSDLRETDWQAQSGCPGWTVQDVVSHMGALFWLVVDPSKLPDVTGLPTERAQDAYVEKRRSMSAAEVLADYESVSAAALPVLDSLSGQSFEIPLGDLGTYRADTVPAAYSFDHYVHIRMDLFAPRGPLTADPPPSDELRLAPTLDWVAAALPQQNADVVAGPAWPRLVRDSAGPSAAGSTLGSGDPLGEVSLDGRAFVAAVTQRADWSAARIDAKDAELSPALLARLKVFEPGRGPAPAAGPPWPRPGWPRPGCLRPPRPRPYRLRPPGPYRLRPPRPRTGCGPPGPVPAAAPPASLPRLRACPAPWTLRPGCALSYSGIPGICRDCQDGTATMAHRCCSRRPGNDNDGPALLLARHPWDIVVVGVGLATASVGHGCGSLGEGGVRQRGRAHWLRLAVRPVFLARLERLVRPGPIPGFHDHGHPSPESCICGPWVRSSGVRRVGAGRVVPARKHAGAVRELTRRTIETRPSPASRAQQ